MENGNRIFNIQGNYIENQTITITDGGVMNFGLSASSNDGTAEHDETAEATDNDLTDELTDELKGFFYNSIDDVRRFVEQTRNAKPADVIGIVKKFVEERKISDMSCNKPLWEVLYRHKIYTRQLSTWNYHIRS